jgi:hypothetical protein
MNPHEHEWLRRRAKAQQAIGIVLDRLALQRPSQEVSSLRTRAERVLEAACSSHEAAPALDHQQWLLERIVALDATMRALER